MSAKGLRRGHIDEKQCSIFPADERADTGIDDGMPVSRNQGGQGEQIYGAEPRKRTKTGGTREQSTLGEGAMPRANLNLPPKDDMGSKIVPWEKRHAAGKDLGRSVLRESHSEWVPPKDRPVLKHTSKR